MFAALLGGFAALLVGFFYDFILGELQEFSYMLFENIYENVSSEFVNFFWRNQIIEKQLKLLNEKLKEASGLRNDAEGRQLDEPKVKEWLDELKDVIYRAQDLMDEIHYEAQRSKHEPQSESNTSFLNKMKSKFDKTIQGEIAKILKDLNRLLNDEVAHGLKVEDDQKNSTAVEAPTNEPLTSWLQARQVRGRDADKKKIMDLLLSNEVWGGKIGVLPIVGMGGLGKTTLAQQIYDDGRWQELDFDVKAWVTVSIDFDIVRILEAILQQVASPQSTGGIKERTELQRKLNEALKDKKFLIVLDDVWNEDYINWDVLMNIFEFGERESRVIVTTRSNKVASNVKTGPIHRLRPVPVNDRWQIFADHAFDEDSNADPDLIRFGKDLVKKCGGIPLALKSLGGLLRSEKDPEKWRRIIHSNVWEIKKFLPSLWLSYRYLSPCLKQCFAYCSVFPKDHEFSIEEIILLWMAEGLLQSSDKEKKQMEELGKEYFGNLVSRSLFERSSSHNKSKYVMHGLVHDLAMFVSGEFCFALDDNEKQKLLTSKTRHLSYKASNDHEYLRKGLSEAKHLRTFMELGYYRSYGDGTSELDRELLVSRKCIKVLSLRSENWIKLLPDSISYLKHLRYLDLSGALLLQEIPCSICTLYNLQTLLLSKCFQLTRLPKDIGRLVKLRHLEITDVPLKEMPPQMGKLIELQTLPNFVLGEVHDNASGIKELGKLQHLSGKLCISGLQNVANVKDAREARLRNKEKLTELTFEWKRGTIGTERDTEVLNALCPHTNLEKLTIVSYAGSLLPNWMSNSSFSNVVSIHLSDIKNCRSLPSLGQLVFLRELVIQHFDGVETIGAEFYGSNSSITPFNSLETLRFDFMPEWKQWSFIGGERKGGVFPSLKQLWLNGCPKLTGSLPDLDKLETLQISAEKLEFPGSHRYVSMRELEIRRCDSVKSLSLDHFPSLEKLKIQFCRNLESLTFSEESGTAEHDSLRELDLSGCENFRSLPQYMHRHFPSLATLRIDDCPKIMPFPEGGLPFNLKEISIGNCSKLVATHKYWKLQGLTSLSQLRIESFDKVFDSFPKGLLPVSLTHFSLSGFPNLRKLNGSAFQHVTSLHELSLDGCKKLEVLPKRVLMCNSLRSLSIQECPILEGRYKPEKGKDWHKISSIPDIIIGRWTK